MTDQEVSFRWKDYRHPQRRKIMTITPQEFIRRFLLHTLPSGFQRIRYYGLLTNAHRQQRLAACRQQLMAPIVELLPEPKDYRDFFQALCGRDLRRCPWCGAGTMIRILVWSRDSSQRPGFADSS